MIKQAGTAAGGHDAGKPVHPRYGQAEKVKQQMLPAVFLDRDGVLNVDAGYVHRPEQFKWVDGVTDAIKMLNEAGYLVIVVTNQSGIGRGFYSEGEFLAFTRWIGKELQSNGAHIDATYYCHHHPTEAKGRYRTVCNCRKPKPGLIECALAEWPIDKARSLMIGNKASDLKAASCLGMSGHQFHGGNLKKFLLDVLPDLT